MGPFLLKISQGKTERCRISWGKIRDYEMARIKRESEKESENLAVVYGRVGEL